jgi:uncharacterized membrane protein YfcA
MWGLDIAGAFAGLTAAKIAAFGAIVFAAAVLRGYSGFGFAIAAVPLLALFMAPELVVVIAVGMQMLGGFIDAPSARAECERAPLVWMIGGAIAGSPLGAAALAAVAPRVALLAISAICFVSVIALASGFAITGPFRRREAFASGVLAGVFNGVAAMPGPPAVAYLIARGLPAARMRATLSVFFLATALAGFAALAWSGLVTGAALALTALGFPLMAAGTFVGVRLFRWNEGRAHRRVALALLFAIAVTSGAKALSQFL